jgi:hypothetical protein
MKNSDTEMSIREGGVKYMHEAIPKAPPDRAKCV